jgi:hypothetical protein
MSKKPNFSPPAVICRRLIQLGAELNVNEPAMDETAVQYADRLLNIIDLKRRVATQPLDLIEDQILTLLCELVDTEHTSATSHTISRGRSVTRSIGRMKLIVAVLSSALLLSTWLPSSAGGEGGWYQASEVKGPIADAQPQAGYTQHDPEWSEFSRFDDGDDGAKTTPDGVNVDQNDDREDEGLSQPQHKLKTRP